MVFCEGRAYYGGLKTFDPASGPVCMGLRHWRREMELSTSHMPDEEKEEDDMAMTNWKRKTQIHCHL